MRTGRPPEPKIIVNCAHCGKELPPKFPSTVKRNTTGRFFCSTECRNIVGSKPKTGIERPCDHCGTLYYVPKGRQDRSKYCSRACQDRGQVNRETRACETCGNDFEFVIGMAKWNAGKYCSRECYRGRPVARNPWINQDGYVQVWVDGKARGQHRVIMEQHLGRPLVDGENVHHRNGDRTCNDIANLELWSTSQPCGQRVLDKLAWAREILATYEPIEHILLADEAARLDIESATRHTG